MRLEIVGEDPRAVKGVQGDDGCFWLRLQGRSGEMDGISKLIDDVE